MTSMAHLSALIEQDTSATANTPARRGNGARVLLIDDERPVWRALQRRPMSSAFELAWASTAAHGLELAAQWRPDVVILELSLPDRDGLEVCRWLRTWSAVPIIVLSARDSEADTLLAFEEGADDYVTKPFSMAELLARIRVALRHMAQSTGSARGARFEAGGLSLDFERRQVTMEQLPAECKIVLNAPGTKPDTGSEVASSPPAPAAAPPAAPMAPAAAAAVTK